MSTADRLLEWASEKGTGTWQELKDAWQWLASATHGTPGRDPAGAAGTVLSNMIALGYIEIRWSDKSWAVAPPTITALPNSGGRGFLTGARTRALFALDLSEDTDGWGTGKFADEVDRLALWLDPVRQREAPTSVLIASESPDDLEELANRCGIRFTYSVSAQLARMLPPLTSYVELWEPKPMPEGFPLERFDSERLRWVECDEDEANRPGLYRATTWSEHIHTLVTATKQHLRASRQEAVYEVLRWEGRDVIQYLPEDRELWVPRAARLPLMHERVAVLCSGQLPYFKKWQRMNGLTYQNVPPEIADLIARSLSQHLGRDG